MPWVDKEIESSDVKGSGRSEGYRVNPSTDYGAVPIPNFEQEAVARKKAKNADMEYRNAKTAAKDASNKALGDTIGAIGDGILKGVEVADDQITKHIAQKISEDVASVEDALFGVPGSVDASSFKDAPEGLKAGVRAIEGAGMAAQAGRLGNPAHFYNTMRAKIAQMKSEYPGWADQVEKLYEANLGFDPDNALRQELISQAAEARAAARAEDKRLYSLFEDARDAGLDWAIQPGKSPDELIAEIKSGKKDEGEVHRSLGLISQQKTRADLAKYALSAHKDKAELQERLAMDAANGVVDLMNRQTGIADLEEMDIHFERDKMDADDVYDTYLQKYREHGIYSDMTGQKGAAIVGSLKANIAIKDRLVRHMVATQEEYTAIRDKPELIQGLVDRATDYERGMVRTLAGKEADTDGIIATKMAMFSEMQQGLSNQMFTMATPEQRAMAGLEKALGSNAVTAYYGANMKDLAAAQGSVEHKMLMRAMAASAVLEVPGNVTPIQEKFDRNASLVKATPTKSRSSIASGQPVRDQNYVAEGTLEIAANATVLTGDTRHLLNNMESIMSGKDKWWREMSTDAKRSFFNTIQSPKFIKAAQKANEDNPEVVRSFVDWSTETFLMSNKPLLDEMAITRTDLDKGELRWDEKKGELTVDTNVEDLTPERKVGLANKFFNRKGRDDVKTAQGYVTTLNAKLRRQAALLKVVYPNPTEELFRAIQFYGVNLDAERQGSMFTRLYGATKKRSEELKKEEEAKSTKEKESTQE